MSTSPWRWTTGAERVVGHPASRPTSRSLVRYRRLRDPPRPSLGPPGSTVCAVPSAARQLSRTTRQARSLSCSTTCANGSSLGLDSRRLATTISVEQQDIEQVGAIHGEVVVRSRRHRDDRRRRPAPNSPRSCPCTTGSSAAPERLVPVDPLADLRLQPAQRPLQIERQPTRAARRLVHREAEPAAQAQAELVGDDRRPRRSVRNTAALINPWAIESPITTSRFDGCPVRSTSTLTPSVGSSTGGRGSRRTVTLGRATVAPSAAMSSSTLGQRIRPYAALPWGTRHDVRYRAGG